MIDELTGIYNGQKCEELFKQPVKKDTCCICFDINGTGAVNQKYGTQAGDQLLKDFVKYAKRVIDGEYFFGRVKSDDFCIMLYGVDETEAKLFLSKLDDEIRIHNKYSNILGSFYGTVLSYSCGYAMCDKEQTMDNVYLYYAAFYNMMVGKKRYKEMINANTKIMVVEDSFLSRNMLVDILKDLGYEVTGVTCGKELFDIIEEFNPQIVITGLFMADTDGLSLVNRLQTEYHNIKIMVCSSISDDDTRKEAFERGADEYVTKPFDREMIKSAVNRLKMM